MKKKAQSTGGTKSSKQTSLLTFFGSSKPHHGTGKTPEKKRPVESSPAPTSSRSRRKKNASQQNNATAATSPPSLASPPCSSPPEQDAHTPSSALTVASTPPSLSPLDGDGRKLSDGVAMDSHGMVSPSEHVEKEDARHVPSSSLSSNEKDESEATMKDGHTDIVDEPVTDTSNHEPSDGEPDEEGSDSDSDCKKVTQSENLSGYDSEDGRKLSEYELLRKRNIERNNRRLAALGLVRAPWSSDTNQDRRQGGRKEAKTKRRKISGNTTENAPSVPTRRSTRTRRSVNQIATDEESSSKHIYSSGQELNYHEVEEEVVQEEQYMVSPIVNYAMNASHTENINQATHTKWSLSVSPEAITSLKPVGKRLVPPNGLTSIYTLQFYPEEFNPAMLGSDDTWIVGAGKAGIVSLWDCNWSEATSATDRDGEWDEIDPVLSWKAHGGRWVADARFLPQPNFGHNVASEKKQGKHSPSRLLTAANDGCVCLWDLTAVSLKSGAPKLLSKTGNNLHRSGIFAMDVSVNGSAETTYVCTGSKDKTVAVTHLDSISRGPVGRPIWVSDYHCNKVGAVALLGKGTALLASASDDGTIVLHDFRADGKGDGKNKIVAELADAHSRPHSVVWNPLSENEIMTAGHDDIIHTFDIRLLKKPLASFHGHVPSNTARCKKIHRPVFYNPCRKSTNAGEFILTGGEGSRSLSMFRNQSPDAKERSVSVYSRGRLPTDCGDAASLAVGGERVAATVDGGEILLLAPQV